MNNVDKLADAISGFGLAAAAKLSNPSIAGAPEDQLRAPLEALVRDLAVITHPNRPAPDMVGETTLGRLKTRPDYAVTVGDALVGFIEIKAPGKGADPRKFRDQHDKQQWEKLSTLPNLIYTDGNSFSLWRDGKPEGAIVHLDGDIEGAGARLKAPPALETLFHSFLDWAPIAPRNAKQLAHISARLCRLLRREVKEELERKGAGLASLAGEWRNLLFPDASDDQFADGYAQAVTFGLLVARVSDIDLSKDLDSAANELRQSSTLIGTALRLLIDNPDVKKALETSLHTLTRVLNEVNWAQISKGDADAWLYFYEDFLEIYDNTLRKKTGSYYTPPEVVNAMVRLTDEALRDPELFNENLGLAAPTVTICDPAVGTGTFLLGVLRHIAKRTESDYGRGQVGPAIEAAIGRMYGFELQFGPYAVAQLRLLAELKDLMGSEAVPPDPKLFVTDTLGDPYAAETQFSSMVGPIGESRKEANRIKREEPITVVIGNPPYKNKAKGLGGWIEKGTDSRDAAMAQWTPPPNWGVGAHLHVLKNLYVYFWRWASLQVFGSGWSKISADDAKDDSGVVCFITVAGFLNGPGFSKMREELRRDCSEIWVIDCSPEGHRPAVSTRIFQGVQHPVCVVIAARAFGKDRNVPATLKFFELPSGHREHIKFRALAELSLSGSDWKDGANGWRDPLLPEQDGTWPTFPLLAELFDWSGSGVTPHRTWPISPDIQSLERRWDALQRETDLRKKQELFQPDADRNVNRLVKPDMGPYRTRNVPVSEDIGGILAPVRYAFRSLDRQWIPPDHRLLSRARPTLWSNHSDQQIYLTVPEDRTPTAGPALSICSLIPDLHHYHGRGGRVYPLWRTADAATPNVRLAVLGHISAVLGNPVSPPDLIAYIAAVLAHPGFTRRFANDLKRPGLRVPITASADLFRRAAALGLEVIWLHTYGERFADAAKGRPAGAPRMSREEAPFIPQGGTIPGAPEPLPDDLHYDAAKRRLHVGKGHIDNVTQAMVDYEVSGMNVLTQWFSYRKRDRSRPIIGDRRPPSPLSKIQPDHWLHEYTTDLIDLLNVLGRLVALEPRQAKLLDELLEGPLLDHATLLEAGALGSPEPGTTSG